MKRAVSVSIGSSKRDKAVHVSLMGEEISIDFNPFWRDDISIKTSYGSSPFDHDEAMEFIHDGRIVVSDMVTHHFPLEEIQDAFNMAADGRDCLKVVINMP